MLRALDPHEPHPPSAYRVPWLIDRDDATHPVVTNAGGEPADFVRVFVDGPRRSPATVLWGQMLPGESAEVCLCEVDPDDAVVTIAWFRPADGVEYVWRFVM